MIRSKSLSLFLSCAVFLALAPKIASADDFAPPPWPRPDPFAITAEWEFETPANPTAPTPGPLTNVFFKGSGSVATSALIAGPGIGWGIGTGDGGWFFPGPGSIEFTVDNIIDFRPVKFLRMQVTHTPGLGLGVDTMAGANFRATGSVPGGVTITPFDAIHTLFTWSMFPNPPYEYFSLLITGGGEIDEIVVDTISIPEPSTLGLCSLLSLGLAARRRRPRAS